MVLFDPADQILRRSTIQSDRMTLRNPVSVWLAEGLQTMYKQCRLVDGKTIESSTGWKPMPPTLRSVMATFGAETAAKLNNVGASGEPENQLRSPFEKLVGDMAELSGLSREIVTTVGETSLGDLKTRPDYAVTVRSALVGFVEIKAPGKGADPRRFKDRHDKEQWAKLQSLPNLLYTDGNQFSLWRSGEPEGAVVRLIGDVETSGVELDAPPALLVLFDSFLKWQPEPPRTVRKLAEMSARLCRLLRDEVAEQLSRGSPALTALATDWRRMLFPDASDGQFADGYAQAVTFGMLVARARDIRLADGLDQVARQLAPTNSLIGSALRILTDTVESQATLKTSLGTLTRVLDVVHWSQISKGDPDAWLYFYEAFLAVYDNELRKQTGSYYTPPEVVEAMVRLVDEALRSERRFALPTGLASPAVTVADPAVGTGTFLLGVLRRISDTIAEEQGEGAVRAAINAAMRRVVAFEIQLGPFAVAQLRILAELTELIGAPPNAPLRMFVTDTLSDPYVEAEWLPSSYEPIAESRRQANAIKIRDPITVVIGNPPYKEKAKGLGGWVENRDSETPGILNEWMPPPDWNVGAHAKHLRNLYVYFWRWATWKVFDQNPEANTGIVCFITVAGFLNGPGFQKMRDYLRRTADEIWVIDCSPEGHQPEVNTRIFQGVQQPVCIVLASRSPKCDPKTPAKVRHCSLPAAHRDEKFAALKKLKLGGKAWAECSAEWRAPFLPAAAGAWSSFPALEDLFLYNGSGVMPGRTWVIAPDAESLHRRWKKLVSASKEDKKALFHPHLVDGLPGDRHSERQVSKGLPGHETRTKAVSDDHGDCVTPVRYGFRSFDRQWIIPDNRLINRPNPELWEAYSSKQTYFTTLVRASPSSGPALTFTALVPDHDHYKGSFSGRVFPLWRDRERTVSNVSPGLLSHLSLVYRHPVSGEDVMAYVGAVAAHPAFTSHFQSDLTQPGLRIPITADRKRFAAAADLGRTVIWLHTFGERFANPKEGRKAGPPRLPKGSAPRIPTNGAIPEDPEGMPDSIGYDAGDQRLHVGTGFVEGVPPEVWRYEVSGKQVLKQWFSYRKKNRERPLMGDRRPPSALGEIQPDRWLAEYTTELIDLLHVLGRLVELEPAQAKLLERICAAPLITVNELRDAGAFATPPNGKNKYKDAKGQKKLLD